MALLAGDALLTRAFEIMLKKENRQGLPEGAALEAASVLADAAGIEGMVGGQVIDLQSEGREVGLEVLEELQRGKTAALLTAACEMGCLLAGRNGRAAPGRPDLRRKRGARFSDYRRYSGRHLHS